MRTLCASPAHRRQLGAGEKARRRNMRIDLSFLPALGACLCSKHGTMLMLLPGGRAEYFGACG
jgi:hypothetical protein